GASSGKAARPPLSAPRVLCRTPLANMQVTHRALGHDLSSVRIGRYATAVQRRMPVANVREDILTYSVTRRLATAASAIVLGLAAGPAMAQWATEADMIAANPVLPWTDRYESESVGRGWDFVNPEEYDLVGATTGFTGARFGSAEDVIAARDGAVPEGIEALERDLYTSDDFYIDRDLWSDPRYFRCNSGL